ncbi:MAG: GLPGLI family protein [Rhodothermales bacterium]|nr:GLPGLI family protein [Rhodothermales bacterium]
MPRTILASTALFLALMAAPPVSAQQGTINYDRTVKIEIDLPPEMAHMADRFPESRTVKRVLHFTETETVMRDAPEQKLVEEERRRERQTNRGGDRVMIRMGQDGPEEILYTSLETEDTVQRRNFMGRTFLINGQREPIKWKLSGEQSEYQGYLTMRATATVDTTEVEAWFTPQIPLPIGPDEYGGLPGAILVLTVDEGRQTYKATAVDLDAVPEIEQPEDGREVTEEEFEKIVEEKMEEMRAQTGGRRGGFRVRINN